MLTRVGFTNELPEGGLNDVERCTVTSLRVSPSTVKEKQNNFGTTIKFDRAMLVGKRTFPDGLN